MNARILITCVGGIMLPDLLIHLRADTVLTPYIVGVDTLPTASGRLYVDKFYQVPNGEDDAYINTILRIIKKEKIQLILPGSDQEALTLAKYRAEISSVGTIVLTSPISVLKLLCNKCDTYQELKSAGVRVPQYIQVTDYDDLVKKLPEFGYPQKGIVIKPVMGRGGRAVRLLLGQELSRDELHPGQREEVVVVLPTVEKVAAWFVDGPLMLMPLFLPPVYDVDIFAKDGEIEMSLIRKRTNPGGIPFVGNVIVTDNHITQYCQEIVKNLCLDGLHDIDLITDFSGNPVLLEVNPRPSGSVVAAHAAGFPIVSAAIVNTLGGMYPLRQVTQEVEITLISRAVSI